MAQSVSHPWGEPIWSFPIPITRRPLTDDTWVDVAIVGAGFTGLATAHYVQQLCPDRQVVVFEAQQVGNGASGRTGGLVLEDTAVGPLPGVGDCVATVQKLVRTQGIQCDLRVDGCWEIGRQRGQATSPIQWADHGTLRVVYNIPGGAFDPRRFLAGLAERVQKAGGQIFEQSPVTGLHLTDHDDVCLTVAGKTVRAGR
ncbi:MAG: FAD-binding oxidoreductase, partial [Candidatus Tectomicrobia bacterium]|nr:FAD-binding oxidoreductase [Candidatus Tectomicrobia bacterium]